MKSLHTGNDIAMVIEYRPHLVGAGNALVSDRADKIRGTVQQSIDLSGTSRR